MNTSFHDGVQFAWDATSIKLAKECPRKYFYIIIEGWFRPEKSFHLTFGAHYATALEHYYKHLANGADKEEALVRVVEEALVNTWEYRNEDGSPFDLHNAPDGMMPPVSHGPWQSPDTAKNRENLIRTIIWYVDHFPDKEIKIVHLPDGRPAVEYSFSLEVDADLLFCGHLDRVVEWAEKPYVMDQKTTGTTLTMRYFDQFSPDDQMSMYTFAGKAIFHLPVKGVIIDAAQIAVGFSRFERGFTFRSDDQLDEWYAETVTFIKRFQDDAARGYYPMNPTACFNYGGCQFRSICSRSAGVRPNFLAAEFKPGKIWDPLQRR